MKRQSMLSQQLTRLMWSSDTAFIKTTLPHKSISRLRHGGSLPSVLSSVCFFVGSVAMARLHCHMPFVTSYRGFTDTITATMAYTSSRWMQGRYATLQRTITRRTKVFAHSSCSPSTIWAWSHRKCSTMATC